MYSSVLHSSLSKCFCGLFALSFPKKLRLFPEGVCQIVWTSQLWISQGRQDQTGDLFEITFFICMSFHAWGFSVCLENL